MLCEDLVSTSCPEQTLNSPVSFCAVTEKEKMFVREKGLGLTEYIFNNPYTLAQ